MASPFTPATIPSAGVTPPVTLTGTTDATELTIVEKSAQTEDSLAIRTSGGLSVLTVGGSASAGLDYQPDGGDSNASFSIDSFGEIHCRDDEGNTYLVYDHAADTLTIDAVAGTISNVETGILDVGVNAGFLRHWRATAPADATIFNNSFAFWIDPAVPSIKIKAKISGSIKTAEILLS